MTALLKFLADWQEICDGDVRAGESITIEYAPERLPAIRTTWHGAPIWDIEVYLLFHPTNELFVLSTMEKIRGNGGTIIDMKPRKVGLQIPKAVTALEIWFRNSHLNVSGSVEERWDSNFGQNYNYSVEIALE